LAGGKGVHVGFDRTDGVLDVDWECEETGRIVALIMCDMEEVRMPVTCGGKGLKLVYCTVPELVRKDHVLRAIAAIIVIVAERAFVEIGYVDGALGTIDYLDDLGRPHRGRVRTAACGAARIRGFEAHADRVCHPGDWLPPVQFLWILHLYLECTLLATVNSLA